MLVGPGLSAKYMYNGLKNEYNIIRVIRASGIPGGRKKFIKKRVKRLGYWTVFGQILFKLFCVRALNFFSKARVKELQRQLNLSDTDFTEDILIDVPSVNSDECLETLRNIDPDIIIVNGTTIITKRILDGVKATFVNTHVGITPKYRGVHGGYWALVNDDQENCGVTVHLVDTGIDTGGILYQGIIHATKKDNFTTYPYLQIAEGINLMKQALNDIINDTISPKKGGKESKLWYHPTIWNYLYIVITKGVK